MSNRIIIGDALTELRNLPDECVHCCVTSPPYYGLRDYGTAQWDGGDAACDHRVGGQVQDSKAPGAIMSGMRPGADASRCKDCGARRIDQQIGLEPSPDEYVAALVAVFREVRRVLRRDGTLWLSIGDSYNAGREGGHAGGSKQASLARHEGITRSGANVSGLKPKDLIGIPWMLAFALRADGWWLRQDIIWCLSGGARVYAKTQKGEMPMMIKDLVRLDPATVQLWNGEKWTQALGWSRATDTGGALEIELRSGERIGATLAHQWPTRRGLVKTEDLRAGDVIETTMLPEPRQAESPKAIGDEFGYFVGLYLAEGSTDSRGRIHFAGHASEHEQRMSAIGYLTDDFGAGVRGYTSSNNSTIVVDSPIVLAILRKYVHGESAHDKGLKVAAWRRSNGFLYRVLEGYLSGDGHHDQKNDRYRLGFTRNDRFAADIRTLCARLGLSLRLAIGTAQGFGKEWPIYRGDLRLTRSAHHNVRQDGEVVGMRHSRAREFWDIGVADEPHLFALASGVLTHNSKPNPMPESVTDRCTKAHEYLFLLSRSERYWFDAAAIAEELATPPHTPGNKLHADKISGPNARGGHSQWETSMDKVWAASGMRNKRSVWTVATAPFSEAHFATFPPALIEPCILAGCPRGGTVLDPFAGAGTTGLVADRLGRNAILIELNPEYAAMARRRIEDDAPLFAEVS